MHLSADDRLRIPDDVAVWGKTNMEIARARNIPLRSVQRAAKKVKANACIKRKRGSDRPRSQTTEVNIDKVREMVETHRENATSSIRKIAREMETSYGTVQRILKEGSAWYS